MSAKPQPYCGDCPDREACHQGVSCSSVRQIDALVQKINSPKGTTNIMSNAPKTNVSPADVAAKAAEEKLVEPTVPAQADGEKSEAAAETNEQPELTVIEGGKQSFKERAKSVSEKIKENKKAFIALGVAAAAASVAIAKVAAKRALEKETLVTESEEAVIKLDENGHMIDPDDENVA